MNWLFVSGDGGGLGQCSRVCAGTGSAGGRPQLALGHALPSRLPPPDERAVGWTAAKCRGPLMVALRPLPPLPRFRQLRENRRPPVRVALVDGLALVCGFVLGERLIEVVIGIAPLCHRVGLDRTGGAEMLYVRFAGCETCERRDEAFVVEPAEQCRSGVFELGADGQARIRRGRLHLASG